MKRLIIILIYIQAVFTNGFAQDTDGIVLRYGENIDKGYGGTTATVITPYVLFTPEMLKAYTGNQIKKVNIGLYGEATNVYLYIKKKPQDTEIIYKQKIGTLDKGWNTIILDSPFEIKGDSISIGYKATFSDKNPNGVGYSSEYYPNGDYVYWNSMNKWQYTNGSICIQAVINGNNMPDNEITLKDISNITAPYDAEYVEISGIVRNMGMKTITNYDIRYTVDNENLTQENKTVNLPPNKSDTFIIKIPAKEIGTHLVNLEINKVNGETDANPDNNSTSAILTVRDKTFMKRIVVEEGTGTWCGWCPRGIVGLEMMKERYPEQFIGVSVHGSDELEVEGYRPLLDMMPGFPQCFVNRKYHGDPYYDIELLFKSEEQATSHIGYSMEAKFNKDSTAIDVKTSFISDTLITDAQYYASFIVVEDSVKGYQQTNYYAGGRSGEFYGWESLPEQVNIIYNDLARGLYSSFDGDLCSPETILPKQYYEYSYSFNLPQNIQSTRNIRIIGLMIDHNTGYIINAQSATPEKFIESEINDNIYNICPKIYKHEDRITVHLQDHEEYYTIEFYNANGILLERSDNVSCEYDINISNLHGIHFIRISNKSGTRTIKTIL